ncbi:recombinase family protein [Laspinema sp. A4]|uniref:recombinase family protein n=1 Tax=Laspinema sp. D2d TaxID=2953686 RepID=UPI0021BA7002|nr:recombinase family protein [Laspinema sp. D2d]MCT7986394.1 recombinase family protein [Laspinema sp. D2d]
MTSKGFDNSTALYIRVSTEEQAKEGVSIPAQVEKLTAYCQQQGLTVVQTLIDEGVSAGKFLSTRPGGSQLVELVRSKTVRNIVAVKLDRLFRNAADALTSLDQWDKLGASLHLLDFNGMSLDSSSPMGRMMLTMVAGFAELERNLCKQRTRDALQHKKANKQAYSRPVYGYQVDETGKMTPDANEQEAISLIHQMRGDGASLRTIAAKLTELGYKTKRGGKQWYAATIKGILENDIHSG